jgi:plastocyanin
VEPKKKHLPWLACAAAVVVAIPAFAHGDRAAGGAVAQAAGAINAVDFAFENPATGDSQVTIHAGEKVTFAYPVGGNAHDVSFSGVQPTSCVQTAGPNVGAVPPLPASPEGAGWSGQCTFNTPGTYDFVCEAHSFMTGVVTVLPAGTPTPTPMPEGPAATHLKLARSQHGHAVRGSIVVARDKSRLGVAAFAKRSALHHTGSGRILVGHVTRTAKAGTAKFTVTLSRAARKALARRGRLALTVRIAVTPLKGTPFTATKRVTLKR